MTPGPAVKHASVQAIRRRVRFWQRRLGLERWTIRVEFGACGDSADAECGALPEYQSATLRFDAPKVPAAELDAYVTHELAHCFGERVCRLALMAVGDDPIRREYVRDAEETLTTEIQQLILRLAA